ncbi:hypothetical protein BD770DRAFT_386812 [Pilaira anomala]|nr:hypothetical protein BD770DRAFT_386812 [Pilaira anomala]
MNDSLLPALYTYITAEKERTLFFLLQVCFLTLVCYDFHIDCCIKKTLCSCMVCFKEKIIILLGLPKKDDLVACVAQIEELKVKVVTNEKLIQETEDAFVPIQEEKASLEDRLFVNEAVVEGLSRKLENVQVEAQAAYSAGLVHLTSHFAKIRKMKEENDSLSKQIEEFGVFDDEEDDEDLEYDSDLEFSE